MITGGPAFPVPLNNNEEFWGEGNVNGMTLRDYFAAKAMQASLSSPEFMVVITADEALGTNARERIATVSYRYADAMLKARDVIQGESK
jgi:hypothetical protein